VHSPYKKTLKIDKYRKKDKKKANLNHPRASFIEKPEKNPF
jgi:hypothetical protein